jgi:thiamine pyrophosphokinase
MLAAEEAGVSVDVLLGDMDSLGERLNRLDIDPERVISHPAEKDETDTELGLRFLTEKGCSRRVLVGGGGGRLDHLLALVALFERSDYPDVWHTGTESVCAFEGDLALDGCKGQRISFFPLGCEQARMVTEGLKWPLDPLEWGRGDIGVSNEITSERMKVSLKSGRLLAVAEPGSIR